MSKILCISFLLLAGAFAQVWDKPTILYTGDRIAYNPTTLYDQGTRKVHSIFSIISRISYSFGYVYSTPEGNVSDIYEPFYKLSYFFYPKHDAAVINYGTKLFTALTTFKGREELSVMWSEANITEEDPVFSDPVSVVSSDESQRGFPTVLYCQETGRLWVFYYKFGRSGLPSLCYVTRPANSTVFSNEKTVLSQVYPTSHIFVNYTMESANAATLHLFWTMRNETDQSSDLIYMRSEDNGIRWSFAYIADIIAEERFEPIAIYTSKKYLIVSNIDNIGTDANVRLTISTDKGKTWKTYEYPIVGETNPNQRASIVLGSWNREEGIFAYSAFYQILRSDDSATEVSDSYPKGSLKFISLKTMKETELKAPLKDLSPEILVFPQAMADSQYLLASGSMCKSNPFSWCELAFTRAKF